MPDRTKTTSLRVSVSTHERVATYISALTKETGRSATHDQLIGGFLLGVPAWQADLMIAAYNARTSVELDEGEEPPAAE